MKKFGLYSCTCQAGISMHFGPLTFQRSGSVPGSTNALGGCIGAAAGGAAGVAGACARIGATMLITVSAQSSNPIRRVNGNTSHWFLLNHEGHEEHEVRKIEVRSFVTFVTFVVVLSGRLKA